jgi:hypothetical protein
MAGTFGNRTRGFGAPPQDAPTLRYAYRPKTWVMVLSGLFVAICAVVLARVAQSNDRGVIINHLITLDTGQATIFYWVLSAVSVAFVVAAISGVIRSLRAPREVMVDARGVTVPVRGGPATIAFADITDLRIQRVQSQKFLIIHHCGGKATITRSLMPSNADFDTLVEAITARCGGRG